MLTGVGLDSKLRTHEIIMPKEEKAQPWRAHWPPPASVNKNFMAGVKPGEMLNVDGGEGSGAYGFDETGKSVVVPKEKRRN